MSAKKASDKLRRVHTKRSIDQRLDIGLDLKNIRIDIKETINEYIN